jgi:N-acetylmuramoyl-L-alanine amidase
MPRRVRRGRPLIRVSLSRRRALQWLLLPAAPWLFPSTSFASTIASARLWPAQEYTRLIIESATPLTFQWLTMKNPERLALDLEGVELSFELVQLPQLVHPDDPYIESIRVAPSKPGVMRIVIDLKTEVNPQIFGLKPYGEHAHRIVVDLYPLTPPDPLMALLESDPGAREYQPGATVPDREPRPAEHPYPPRKADGRRRIVIAIDPGHGGEDPGAIGRRGTYEKNVTLGIARKLRALIDAEPGMRAMLTRDDDYFVPLHARVQKARRVQADLFVSIHADAFVNSSAHGSSVFALSEHGATSAAARWLAQRENQADLIGGVNLDYRDPVLARTLLDLSQTAQINDSLRVGRCVLEGIGIVNSLHKGSVEQAGFAVLKAPDIPSILVETAFISNPDEETKLRNERQQQRFAESIFAGIKRYFAQNARLARG